MTVKKKTGDAFDAILQAPPKMMPDAKMNSDGHLLALLDKPS